MKNFWLIFFNVIIFTNLNAQNPNFEWANSMGRTGDDSGYNIATDASGNVYITGSFQDTVDFDPGVGVFNLISVGGDDIFLQKTDADGNFIWAKSMGGTGNNLGRAITIDGSGNIYLTGYFTNTVDFDPGAGVFNLTSNGNNDIFIEKLDANGNYIWAKSIGSAGSDQCVSITSDAGGNVYTTGTFQNTVDFDPGTGTTNLVSNGGNDIYIQKLDANGNFVWANSIGGLGLDWGYAITTDNAGDLFITGIFQNTIDFDPGAGTFNLTAIGGLDSYVLKTDANGNFIWATSIGGTGTVFSLSVTTDGLNNVYTTGFFQNTIDFDPSVGTLNLTSNGVDDGFIQKLDGNGNFIWAKSFGDIGNDRPAFIQTDISNNVYTTGSFENTVDFDPNATINNLISAGGEDVFIQKLDTDGNFIWANSMGGVSNDVGVALYIDGFNNVYTTGTFQDIADFDPSAGVFNLTSAGAGGTNDIFIQKLNQCVPVNGTDTRTECDSLIWIDGITYYSNNNTATDTIFGGSFNGCDSIITLNLTINTTPVADAPANVTICEGYILPPLVVGNYYSSSGGVGPLAVGTNITNSQTIFVYAETGSIPNCFDENSFTVTINNSVTSIDTVTACDSLTWIDGITYYNNNNTATHTIFNGASNNCDSIITLNLTIKDSSSNHIEGIVYYQGNPITSGEVTLLRKNGITPNEIIKIDSLQLSGSGFYFFDGLSPGDYLIKALGDTLIYNNVSTYADSTNHWQWAPTKTISFGCNDTLFNVDINLKDYPLNTGSGSIFGTIQENGGPLFRAPGDPIGDIDITVEQSPDGAVSGFDISDQNGEFTFNNLPAGNYYIYADIPGYICDTTYLFNFDGTGISYDVTLCVYDTLNTINICNDIFTSVKKNQLQDNFTLYPNPTTGIINIDFDNYEKYTIEIAETTGKLINTYTSNSQKKSFNFSNYKKGVYIINIILDNEKYSKKLIIK